MLSSADGLALRIFGSPSLRELRTASPLLQLRRQLHNILFFIEIGRDVIGLAFAERIQLFARLCASFSVARRDVNMCTIRHETLRDHATNAFGTAGNEDYFALGSVSLVKARGNSMVEEKYLNTEEI
jgi:hypothetical protein